MCFAPQRCALFRHLNFQKWSEHGVFCTFWLGNVLRATTACTFSTSQLPKVVGACGVLYILTSTCFAPQRCALFRELNFPKWSEHGVLCTFWLGNVLRATTACTFSTCQLPKVIRTRQFFTFLTSKCASRHNSVHFLDISLLTWKCASGHNRVQFFISHLATWLRTRRFSEPTFRPSGVTNHWKKQSESQLSYLFGHLDFLSSETFSSLIFSLRLFSSLTLPTSAFHLSIMSEVWLLNFLRQLHTLHYTNYITLHHTPLHSTTLHSRAL